MNPSDWAADPVLTPLLTIKVYVVFAEIVARELALVTDTDPPGEPT
jgi:hypothetical protein